LVPVCPCLQFDGGPRPDPGPARRSRTSPGDYDAKAAWTVLAAVAHNLLRSTQLLGLPDTTTRGARTLRRRLIAVPGRLTHHARGWTLHLPARWPWHGDYLNALNRIRALPAA
jgi:Transposase DDE domain group 1